MNQLTIPPVDLRKLFIILIALALLIIFSCNPARKIQKAEQTVEMNPQSFYKIGLAWQLLNPCLNDTVIKTIPGEQLVLIDTVNKIWHDSIYNWTYDTTRITKTLKQTDTIKIVTKDLQILNVWKDSVQRQVILTSNLQGRYDQIQKNLTDENIPQPNGSPLRL